ncbi:helix-turn-helix domain-containing protein [Micromonospora chersina]
MDVMTPLLYKTTEAAMRLGCGKTTLYQLIMSGELESVTVGRARRIPAAALEAYVERLRRAAAEELDAAA